MVASPSQAEKDALMEEGVIVFDLPTKYLLSLARRHAAPVAVTALEATRARELASEAE